jgi:hypothetical protein
LVIALACGVIAGSAAAAPQQRIVVTDDDGRVLARLTLGERRAFSLRYRNSLYGTLAEERFTVDGQRFRLDELAAEQLAVLEEYYAVSEAPVLVTDWWSAPPAYELELERLTVAATDLGERTILVEGQAAVPLWKLAADSKPFVHLELERAP